jgi:hypothetical protein
MREGSDTGPRVAGAFLVAALLHLASMLFIDGYNSCCWRARLMAGAYTRSAATRRLHHWH